MNSKSETPAIDEQTNGLTRRGFLTRLGLAVAGVPVMLTLSRAGYASSDGHDGGDDGHDGGHDGNGGDGASGDGGGDRGGDDGPGHDQGGDGSVGDRGSDGDLDESADFSESTGDSDTNANRS